MSSPLAVPASSSVGGSGQAADDVEGWLAQVSPLVALLGLEQLHAAIISNMPTVHGLRFLSRMLGHMSFPSKKTNPRRLASPGYDNYHPSGILKRRWLEKHRDQVPAVAVLLFEWEESKEWSWQSDYVSSTVNGFRDKNSPREIPVMVVVVRNVQAGGAVDETALDKVFSGMARACAIDSKSLLQISAATLNSSLTRMEERIFELSRDYYRGLVKWVKKVRERVSKVHQPLLHTRLNFKIAYFCEAAADLGDAVKYYKRAYDFLWKYYLQTRGKDRLASIEVKAVAFIINFKIVGLHLSAKQYPEAVSQFEEHVSAKYTDANEINDLHFHHSAWMAKQYRTFAEMVEACTDTTFFTDGRMSSGFFYQTAAKFSSERKMQAQRILGILFPSSNSARRGSIERQNIPPYRAEPPDFIGQVGLSSDQADLVGQERATAVVRAICYRELSVEHTTIIIDLLTRAYENFNVNSSRRMILHVACLMAQEYFASRNFPMAKKFFDRIAKAYRKEKWQSLLTSIVANARHCALQLGLRRDFVECSLELMGTALQLTTEKRMAIQQELASIMSEPASSSASSSASAEAPPGPASFGSGFLGLFDVLPDAGLVLASTHFSTASGAGEAAACDEDIVFTLHMSVFFPMQVELLRVLVCFNIPEMNSAILSPAHPPLEPAASGSLQCQVRCDTLFPPGSSKQYQFTFSAQSLRDCATPLTVTRVFVYVPLSPREGAEPLLLSCVPLKPGQPLFRHSAPTPAIEAPSAYHMDGQVDGSPSEEEEQVAREAASTPTPPITMHDVEFGDELGAVRVVGPKAKISLSLRHAPPAIVGEYYRVEAVLRTVDESIVGGHVSLSVRDQTPATASGSASESESDALARSDCFFRETSPWQLNQAGHFASLQQPIVLPDEIGADSEFRIVFFVRPDRPAAGLQLVVAVEYTTPQGLPMRFEESASMPSSLPFASSFSVFSRTPSVLGEGELEVQQVFTLRAQFANHSGHAIRVHRIGLDLLGNAFEFASMYPNHELLGSQEEQDEDNDGNGDVFGGVRLGPMEHYTTVFHIIPCQLGLLRPGNVQIEWSRCSTEVVDSDTSSVFQIVQFDVPVPRFGIASAPFHVEVDFPRTCEMSRVFQLTIQLTNLTSELQDIGVTIPDEYIHHRYSAQQQAGSGGGGGGVGGGRGRSRSTVSITVPVAISGVLHSDLCILPGMTKTLTYIIAPLECGFVRLPALKVVAKQSGRTLFDGACFGSVFVTPRHASVKKRRESTRKLM